MPRFNPAKKINPRDESGFTLLEIIAVLVILSIMAVVAVPKYFDLQTQARQEAIKTAMAEAIGRINGHFAQQILSGTPPDEVVYLATNDQGGLGADLGDFDWEIIAVGAGAFDTPEAVEGATSIAVENGNYATTPEQLLITVTAKSGSALAGESLSRPIPVPGI